jgi:hypothetical protein
VQNIDFLCSRRRRDVGHKVRLMPAQYVKAYIKRNKHDAADAEAICEAVQRQTMRFVPVKTAEPSCRRAPHWLHQCDRTAAAAFSVDLATDQGRLPRRLWPACRRSRRWRYLLRERVP